MTSDRKIVANRRNSQQSTGPRSSEGKIRVRRNALRHGFAVVTLRAPALSAELDRLATAICGKDAHPAHREQALIIAECQLIIVRVRKARLDLIEQIAAPRPPEPDATNSIDPFLPGAANGLSCLEQLARLDRYERRALSRRSRAVNALNTPSSGVDGRGVLRLNLRL